MQSIYNRDLMIDPSMTDIEAKLSYYKAFMLMMDIAAEHAEHLDIGTGFIRQRKMFWLTVKTKICFERRPYQGEMVTLSTWPEDPDEYRCVRSYAFTQNENTLVRGKTEWAVIEMETGKLHAMSDVYPEGLTFSETSCPEDFARIETDFSAADEVSEYVVRSTDIDLGRHMNNTAYIRAAFDTLSNKELNEMDICSIDAVFLSSVKEGEVLEIRKVRGQNGIDFQLSKDRKPVMLLRLLCR